MQETSVLRQLTNLPLLEKTPTKITKTSSQHLSSEQEAPRPPIDQLLQLSASELDFGMCLPGAIHDKILQVTLLDDLDEATPMNLFIVCDDETLNDSPELVFGINQPGQGEYFDDFRLQVKKKKVYEFKVGVKTPGYYSYDVKSYLGVKLGDYPPMVVTLRQQAQIPEIVCSRELVVQENRVIKLSVIQGKSKKQCRVPFKLNHAMTIAVTSEIIGLQLQKNPVIDVKPKSMTLAGKGQFSLVMSMGINEDIKTSIEQGRPYAIRRVLILKIKDTRFIYHFPIQVTYHPSKKNSTPLPQ